jgi:glycosyltransferase involved in cell wall biosynthesis
MLYYDPHPVHRKMAEYVGAELVACEDGGAFDRLRSAYGRDLGDRLVVLEGGVPLTEGAFLKLLDRCGPLVALGADGTYHNLRQPLPGWSTSSRIAHRGAHFFIDGTIAVSDYIATVARSLIDGPVRVAHPFIDQRRYERLRELTPDLSSDEVLCVGKYRRKNGQDVLAEAVEYADADLTVHFVGPDTERIPDAENVMTYGFVEEETLLELFERVAMLAFPAPAGAFPVATLEGLRAGLPTLTTHRVGTSSFARLVHGRMVTEPDPKAVASTMDWYFGSSVATRRELSERASRLGAQFDEETGLETFGRAFWQLVSELDYEPELYRR